MNECFFLLSLYVSFCPQVKVPPLHSLLFLCSLRKSLHSQPTLQQCWFSHKTNLSRFSSKTLFFTDLLFFLTCLFCGGAQYNLTRKSVLFKPKVWVEAGHYGCSPGVSLGSTSLDHLQMGSIFHHHKIHSLVTVLNEWYRFVLVSDNIFS